MLNLCLFGFVPDWVRTWLTPLWLLGLGTICGLLGLLLWWGVMWVLSRVPLLNRLGTGNARRNLAIGLGVVLTAVLGGLTWLRWSAAPDAGAFDERVLLVSVLILWLSFGLAYLFAGYLARRNVDEIPLAIREGVLGPILVVALVMAGFGVAGSFVVRDPLDILASLARLPASGTQVFEASVAAAPAGQAPEDSTPQRIDVNLRRAEMRGLVIESSEPVEIDTQPEVQVGAASTIEVRAGEEYRWQRGQESDTTIRDEEIPSLYVRNLGTQPAQVKVRVDIVPEYPEVATIPLTALSVMGVVLFYFLHRAGMPKASAVALSTTKSEIAQPLFTILLLLGIVSLVLFIWIPYNTFGEDIKMLKDSGLVLIMVLGIIAAVWAASTSIADEIEGRTALTVLSKPLRRQSFIIGKFLGIFWAVALLFIILSVVFIIVVAYKPIYDAQENSQENPVWQVCHFEVVRLVPGLLLAFMETILLAAISVAISTRLPMLANFIICFSIYVLGHLTPLLVQSSVESQAFEVVVFVAQFIAVVFPVLDHFNIQPAVAAGIGVPFDYLGWALLYCSIYGMIALLLALLMFEDRDLA